MSVLIYVTQKPDDNFQSRKRLYSCKCPSVCPSVRPSVCLSVRHRNPLASQNPVYLLLSLSLDAYRSSSLSIIEAIEHRAYQPSSQATLPIIYHANLPSTPPPSPQQLLCQSSIIPISHNYISAIMPPSAWSLMAIISKAYPVCFHDF